MKRFFSLCVLCFILLGTVLTAAQGSCEQYAELVCDICGADAPICEEVREKSKAHPEDAACQKGLDLLPSVYKEASDEDKERIRKTLCRKEMPAS